VAKETFPQNFNLIYYFPPFRQMFVRRYGHVTVGQTGSNAYNGRRCMCRQSTLAHTEIICVLNKVEYFPVRGWLLLYKVTVG